ncbi:uncharacterized protein LOC108162674 isoform X1 [Drosophila miranda]|uniref:Uncharacterized protein Vago isoform X1 n=1 Tax=Drosophila pseudoobscura pseudoobscura TaxID=46245 RepID=A0A0R3NZF3_DROPS|nr:uncharacterized protein LOC4814495 isoform X1 [Drosophila pseudoobscura]XP_017153010.1 uncharacterized protein LOC108162674 isoform X1 [Drosophila miranda]
MESSALTSVVMLVLLAILAGGEAALPYRSASSYRYSQQFCMDTQTGRQLYVGEVFTRLEQCMRVQCLGTLQLWEDSCLVPSSIKGDCRSIPPTESNLEYPRCCPLYECKTYESSAEGTLEQTNTYDHNGSLRKSHLTEVIVINKKPRLDPEDSAMGAIRRNYV